MKDSQKVHWEQVYQTRASVQRRAKEVGHSCAGGQTTNR